METREEAKQALRIIESLDEKKLPTIKDIPLLIRKNGLANTLYYLDDKNANLGIEICKFLFDKHKDDLHLKQPKNRNNLTQYLNIITRLNSQKYKTMKKSTYNLSIWLKRYYDCLN